MAASPLRIASWNVNGVRSIVKRQAERAFLERFDVDVLCLNETKLQTIHVEKAKTSFQPFQHQYWNCSLARKGYSGVAVLSKVQPIGVAYGISSPLHDQEGRVVTAEFPDYYLVATYIPNSGFALKRLGYRLDEWDIAFRSYLKSLKLRGKGVVWIGDLNVVHQPIDIYKLKGNEGYAGCTPQERASFSSTLSEGFCDTFRCLNPHKQEYTWHSYMQRKSCLTNFGWRLDYAVVSEDLMSSVKSSAIHASVKGSDHCPIELVFK